MSFYAEQLAKAVKAHPLDYDSYVEKAKRGQVVPFDGEHIRPKELKKPTSSINRAFNYKKPYMPPTKLCKHCGAIYAKKMRQGFREWDKKKYCSNRCAILARSN